MKAFKREEPQGKRIAGADSEAAANLQLAENISGCFFFFFLPDMAKLEGVFLFCFFNEGAKGEGRDSISKT